MVLPLKKEKERDSREGTKKRSLLAEPAGKKQMMGRIIKLRLGKDMGSNLYS